MELYGPNVLVAFMGAVGVLILTLVFQIKPTHRLVEGGTRRSTFVERLQSVVRYCGAYASTTSSPSLSV